MRLKTQIILGFLFILVLTLILSGIFVYYLNGMGHSSDTVLKGNYRSVKASKEMVVSASKIDQLLAKICLGNNYSEEILREIVANESKIFEANLSICSQSISETGEDQIVENIRKEFSRYLEYISQIDSTSDKKSFYFAILQRHNETLRQAVLNLNELNHSALAKKDAGAQKLYYNARVYVFIFTLAIMVIGVVAIYKIPKLILRPLNDITLKIQQMAEGNYQQYFDENAPGEMGNLGKAVKVLCEKLSQYEASNLAEIKAQKRRIESLMKNLNDGLLLLNEKKEVILVNTAACEILDVPENELIGKKAVELAIENNVIRELLQTIKNSEDDQEELKGSDPKNFIKIEHPDGSQEFYTKEILTIYDQGEKSETAFLGYIITLKDITSFKKSDEAKTSFIATVSHELKTPLSAMNMSLMLLQDQRFGTLNPDQHKIATSMKSEVQRLIRIVTELLDLSKVETGNIQLEKKKVEPQLLIEYSTAPILTQLKEKNIVLDKEIDKEIKFLEVDPEKISWVLINLLNNAIRYSEEGGEIKLQVRKENGSVEFSVRDYGVGIAREDLNKIFNKFVQIKSKNRKSEGSLGLGLAISKEVIEVHGGTIGVDSELGKGSRFFFKLPAQTL